jgi:hypothetical protein
MKESSPMQWTATVPRRWSFARDRGNSTPLIATTGSAIAFGRGGGCRLTYSARDCASRRQVVLSLGIGHATARALLNLPLRSQAYTPLAREGKAIGVMIVNRSEVRPFQVQNFLLAVLVLHRKRLAVHALDLAVDGCVRHRAVGCKIPRPVTLGENDLRTCGRVA